MSKRCPCGKDASYSASLKRYNKYCSKKCFYAYRIRPSGLTYKIVAENRSWIKKGERHSPETEFKEGGINPRRGFSTGYINPRGYKEYYRFGKGELEHRIVVEKLIGRKLKRGECVHHINGDRQDNRIGNLQILTLSEHTKLHHKIRSFK